MINYLLGAFELYDLDRDGYISREEMLAVVDALYRMAGSMVKLPIDEDTAEKRVEKVFRLMDLVCRVSPTKAYLIDKLIRTVMEGYRWKNSSWDQNKIRCYYKHLQYMME